MTSPLLTDDPTRVGAYDLTARLGQGGQGAVYLGRGPDGATVAVKVLSPELAADPKYRTRFAREMEAARRVAAFCTAAVLDADVTAEIPYIVSEYVPGPTLKESVAKEGPRRGAALERLAIATATALVAIHHAGVVHRDFKPANVVLGADGPRVIDFGIARAPDSSVTQTQSVVGTPAYMAPEQILGREIGPAADIFAWGCVIAYASSGSSPFQADTVPTVVNRVLNETPELDNIPEPLCSLVRRCLSKDPDSRPDAKQLLSSLLGQEPEATAALPVTQVLEHGRDAATRQLPEIPTIIGAVAAAQAGTIDPDGEPRTAPLTARYEAADAGPTREDTAPPVVPGPAAARYDTAHDGTVPPPTPPAPVPPTGSSRSQRRRHGAAPWLAVAAAGLLLLAALAGWNWISDFQPQDAEPIGDTGTSLPPEEEPEGDLVEEQAPVEDPYQGQEEVSEAPAVEETAPTHHPEPEPTWTGDGQTYGDDTWDDGHQDGEDPTWDTGETGDAGGDGQPAGEGGAPMESSGEG